MKREKGLVYSFHTFMSLFQILALAVPQQLYSRDSNKTITYGVFNRETVLTWPLPTTRENSLSYFLPPLLFCRILSSLPSPALCWTLLGFCFERTSKYSMFVLHCVYSFVFPTVLCWPFALIRGVCLVGSLV